MMRSALNGFLSRDGYAPLQLLHEARTQPQLYFNVMLAECEVLDIRTLSGGGFNVCTSVATHTASGLLIATETQDQLPDIPGLSDCSGTSTSAMRTARPAPARPVSPSGRRESAARLHRADGYVFGNDWWARQDSNL